MLTELLSHIGEPQSPGFVLLTGEAGVGKTRLLAEFADVAAADGIRLLRGGCLELSEALPYGPLVDVLEQIRAEDGVHAVRELAGQWVDGLHALLPAVGSETAGPPDGHQGQQALFRAVATVLMGVAARGPTLLVIEDLHWASQTTVDLLTFVVYRVAGSRLLIVGSVRDEGVSDTDPVTSLIASLHRSRRSATIGLSGLGREDVGELMTRIRGVTPDARHVARAHELTGGNPLLVEELLAAGFVDDDRVVPAVASWVLGQRLRQLDEDARRVVVAAAVGGARCEQDLLVRVVERAGRDSDQVVDALRRAVDIGILVPAGSDVGFRHALLWATALGSLLSPEVSRLHADWAATLAQVAEATSSISARLAHHWLEAGDAHRALPALLDAAGVAERQSAHAEASRHLEDALDLWDRCIDVVDALSLDRREVLDRAVTAAYNGGRLRVAARRLRELIGLVGPTTDAVTLGVMYARLALLVVGTRSEAVAACERARQLVPADPPSPARTYVLTQEALVRDILHLPRAAEVGQEALDAARQVGDPRLEATALVVAAVAPVESGILAVDEAVRRLERARTLTERFDDHENLGRVYALLSSLLMLAGRLTDGYEVGRAGLRWAEQVGLQDKGAMILANAARSAMLAGRWDEATGLLDLPGWEADAVMEERASLLGELAVRRGDLANADELLRPAFTATSQAGDAEMLAFVAIPMATAQLWQDQPLTALELVEQALRDDAGLAGFYPEMSLVSVGLRAAADLRVSAAARRNRDGVAAARQRASGLVDRMARRDGTTMLALEQADRVTARAELARLDGNDAVAWSAATEAWDDLAMPYEAAYARWRWAEALLADGGARSDAAGVLHPAMATARRLGAEPLFEAMQALSTRARLPTDAQQTEVDATVERSPFAPLGLTAREEEVLRRVAAGSTNRQIAEALFISESTAGVHVSNILRKLGVSNRVQAAAVAHRLLTESERR